MIPYSPIKLPEFSFEPIRRRSSGMWLQFHMTTAKDKMLRKSQKVQVKAKAFRKLHVTEVFICQDIWMRRAANFKEEDLVAFQGKQRI